MEYDFSKIDTDELRKSIDLYSGMEDIACDFIDCDICPFKKTKLCGDESKVHELFLEELERRESMEQEYKEITLDMSVKDIMGLDLNRVETLANKVWVRTTARGHYELIRFIKGGDKYRYKLKSLEVVKITKKLNDLMLIEGLEGSVFENGIMIEYDGHKVEII